MVVEFEMVKQCILVEQALTGQGIYLAQARDEKDRLMKDPDRPKVIVEVSDTGFRKICDDLAKHITDKGLSRFDSCRAAGSAIEELRKFGSLGMRDTHA